MTFTANDNRTDLDLMPGTVEAEKAKRLSAISIETGTFCKQFILSHDYFQDNSAAQSGQYTDYRLRLNRVQEANCVGADSVKPYIFTYYQQPNNPKYLPNRLSSAIDHWGYSNGQVQNTRSGLNIPYTRLRYDNINGLLTDVHEGYANRETNEDSMRLGTIQQIQYPTGGTTTFDFEANNYWTTEGVKKMVDDGEFSLAWSGGQCSINNKGDVFYKTFRLVDLDNMFFIWANKKAYNYCPPNTGCSCTGNTPNVTLKVFLGNSTTPLWVKEQSPGASDTIIGIYADKLEYLFGSLQPDVEYRFELWGTNSASKFIFQKEITIPPTTNTKVGGLRIKSMTASDGIDATKNTVKTYDYSGSIPSFIKRCAVQQTHLCPRFPQYGRCL